MEPTNTAQAPFEADPGHLYNLPNVQSGVQQLAFIKKEKGDVVTDGTTTEQVLTALIMRLKYLNAAVSSDFNHTAIDHLECALGALENRTKDRENRQVEGTNQA